MADLEECARESASTPKHRILSRTNTQGKLDLRINQGMSYKKPSEALRAEDLFEKVNPTDPSHPTVCMYLLNGTSEKGAAGIQKDGSLKSAALQNDQFSFRPDRSVRVDLHFSASFEQVRDGSTHFLIVSSSVLCATVQIYRTPTG